ncbi:hypothetical protein LCGC14_2714710 [marine sediment metagenome]|uniref:HTH marR-type domain-containing protein n=1 Tax=marine sediment metagenome TaxID=412755 RepID=A0A0F9C3L2_9ZZZZ
MTHESELFTARGRLLLRVQANPGITGKALSEVLFLTKRSIWGIVGELRKAGYLTIVKKGRRHHYYISGYGLEDLNELKDMMLEKVQ